MKSKYFGIGLITGIAVAGSTVALASVTESSKLVMTACVNSRSGVLRVIDPASGAKCLNEENVLVLNQQSPQEQRGNTGPQDPGLQPSQYYVVTNDTGQGGAWVSDFSAECFDGDIAVSGYPSYDAKPQQIIMIPILSPTGSPIGWTMETGSSVRQEQNYALYVTCLDLGAPRPRTAN